MPAKRKANAKQDASQKQPKQDGQKAVSKDLNVPLDEGIPAFASPAKVFIDCDGIIFDAALNQSNVGNNNNKFYRAQLIVEGSGKKVKYHVWTRWGRVGEFGQSACLGPFDLDDAVKEFQSKFRSKTGLKWDDRDGEAKSGKYTYIQRSYEDDGDEGGMGDVKDEKQDDEEETIKSKLPIHTQRLVQLIFDNNHFNAVLEDLGYNADKLPLGKLGKDTITKGFGHLKELASLIRHPKLAQNKYQRSQNEMIEEFTNKYYSTIPHVFGRSRPRMINHDDILRKEVAMLDSLSEMAVANEIMKVTSDKSKDAEGINLIDKRFKELKCDSIDVVEHDSSEYQAIQDYLVNSAGHTHNMRFRLQSVFRVARSGENDRFLKSEFNNRHDSCRRLLWHGSRTTNFGGILSQGLKIAPPEAPVNGYAFGKGIYLADISTKSAQYCSPSLSGGHGLLLLVEAELGNPMYELTTGDFNAGEDAKKQGRIATNGIGRTIPGGWVDAECIHEDLKGVLVPDASKRTTDNTKYQGGYLQYNEYIAYAVEQLRLRYLVRFSM